MTRINVGVKPCELPTRLLMAEHREIVRIPNMIKSGRANLFIPIPQKFTLGPGHVRFFYDKIKFLYLRYTRLHYECKQRDFRALNMSESFDPFVDTLFWGDYQPTKSDRKLIVERIQSKGHSLLEKETV